MNLGKFFSSKISKYIAAILVVIIAFFYKDFIGAKRPPMLPPPPVVGIASVVRGDFPINFEVPGKLYGSNETEIRAQVSGILKTREFKEGEYIKKDTTLFTIDKEKYQNAFDVAKGSLSQAESEIKRAERNYKRTSKLFNENAVSQKQYDDALSQFEKAKANVQIASATLDTAKINLEYTDVKAPISGIVRKEEKSIGNLINVTGLLTSMVQITPLNVEFYISGTFWNEISKGYKDGVLKLLEQKDYKVQLVESDGTYSDEYGEIIFMDSAENPETGCISVKANFPNSKKTFLPGQFIRVNVIGAAYTNVLLIPSSAIIQTPSGNIVYHVKDDNTAEIRPVKIKLVKDYAIVLSGLNEGEKIVTEGIIKVRPGEKVTPLNKQKTIDLSNKKKTK